ncbi:MAG: alkaline phosphatase family protein [Deltaproteobacteria bacterium]|nr:alkaline phosphatase family protein [Deltaproteobacteria bacterium]
MTIQDGFYMSRAVRDAYRTNSDDETLEPMILFDERGNAIGRIAEGDSVIFYNIRGEREIELTESLTDSSFDRFPVKDLGLTFATMIEYQKGLNVDVAFPPEEKITDTLSATIAAHNLKQVKITEAEKAIHLSFFLNGKDPEPVKGEERIIIPTRKDVALFDEAPEMSIEEITKATIEKVRDGRYDFIVVNFPNVDVVGHIENETAIKRAVEVVDENTGTVVYEALREDMTVIVTADHGTVEQWLYPDGAIDTGHTDSPVPFIVIEKSGGVELRGKGDLTDIAPTVLELMGIAKPDAMSGKSLLKNHTEKGGKRILFLILDGWGLNESEKGNLIAASPTPVMDKLLNTYPFSVLAASGKAVGLPEGTVGNSEVGHLHIGAGRKIFSDRVKIGQAIAEGSFSKNDAFLHAIEKAKENSASLHLLGIVSFFSSHGSVDHLFALMELAKREGIEKLFIHAMLGRRGEKPESGAIYIEKIEKKCRELQLGEVVSVIGRYWSMDREENWDRIEKTYNMLVFGKGNRIVREK